MRWTGRRICDGAERICEGTKSAQSDASKNNCNRGQPECGEKYGV